MRKLIMKLLGKRKKRDMYDELMCDLFDKQIAAREAMGAKWCCHPANNVQRLTSRKHILRIVQPSSFR